MGFNLVFLFCNIGKLTCSGLNCVLRSSQMDTLNPHVTLFGDRASKEVITVKGGRKDGALTRWACWPLRRGSDTSDLSLLHTQGKGHARAQWAGGWL